MKNKILLIISVIALVSCSSKEKRYIKDTLPQELWKEQVSQSVDDELRAMNADLNKYSRDSVRAANVRLDQLSDIGWEEAARHGLNSDEVMSIIRKRDKIKVGLSKFNKNVKSFPGEFKDNVSEILESLSYDPSLTCEEYDNVLMFSDIIGSPFAEKQPCDSLFEVWAAKFVNGIASKNGLPKVSYMKYDKKSETWYVRFDGADPVYVKAYKRSDGDYDFEHFEADSEDFLSESPRGSKGGKTDWDKVLDDYEKFIKNYGKLIKKVKSGNMDVLSEYAECLEHMEDLSDELKDAENTMTSSQLKRYQKLLKKASDIALETASY